MEDHADGQNWVTVGMWLLNSPMGASLYSVDIVLEFLPELVHDWTQDPELFMHQRFSYFYEPAGKTVPLRHFPQPQFTLQDLGLK